MAAAHAAHAATAGAATAAFFLQRWKLRGGCSEADIGAQSAARSIVLTAASAGSAAFPVNAAIVMVAATVAVRSTSVEPPLPMAVVLPIVQVGVDEAAIRATCLGLVSVVLALDEGNTQATCSLAEPADVWPHEN